VVVKREDKSLQMTIMLIIVSTSYVLAYVPVLIHFVVWRLERAGIVSVSNRTMLIAQNYTRMLYVAGFAINFFLYTVSGRVFRKQLIEILSCRHGRYIQATGDTHPASTTLTTVHSSSVVYIVLDGPSISPCFSCCSSS